MRSRAAMMAALLALAGGALAARECGSKSIQEPRDVVLTPEQKRMAEAQWMFRMRLPEIGVFEEFDLKSDAGTPLSETDVSLEGFRIRFDELGRETEEKLANLKDEKAREQVLYDYIVKVIQAHKVATGDRKPEKLEAGSVALARLLLRVNDSLVPRGAYLHAKFDLESRVQITQYQVAQTGEVQVGNRRIKVAKVNSLRGLNCRPGDPVARLNGLFQAKIETAVVDKEGADVELAAIMESYKARCVRAGGVPRDLGGKVVRDDFQALGISHEMAHAHLSHIEYDTERNDALVRRGGIPMGAYDFPPEALVKVNNPQIHELFANGIGLMKSGEAAPVVAQAMVVGSNLNNYVLARDLIWREIVFSPELDPQVRSELLTEINATQSIPFDRMIEAINRLSPEALHRIGERMAKAALYLMGK